MLKALDGFAETLMRRLEATKWMSLANMLSPRHIRVVDCSGMPHTIKPSVAGFAYPRTGWRHSWRVMRLSVVGCAMI